MNAPGNRKTVFQLFIDDRVSTDDRCPRFVNLVLSSTKNLGEDFDRQRADGKADNAKRCEWLTTHGVHIGQSVRGSDLSELVWIVDDGREEVDGLNERETIGQPENSRVIEGLSTDKDAGIGSRVQRREGAGQVTRTQLGGSTRAAGELGQSEGFFSEVGHDAIGERQVEW